MPYAHIPENIQNLDLGKNFSINELQTLKKIGSAASGAIFVARASSRYSVVRQQRHMVTLVASVEPPPVGVSPRTLISGGLVDVTPRAFGCSLI